MKSFNNSIIIVQFFVCIITAIIIRVSNSWLLSSPNNIQHQQQKSISFNHHYHHVLNHCSNINNHNNFYCQYSRSAIFAKTIDANLIDQNVEEDEMNQYNDNYNSTYQSTSMALNRRTYLSKILFSSAITSSLAVIGVHNPSIANAVAQRAVGSGEIKCRELNNCLETGELDGAIGWEWGGKDRCDASDPLCGPNGQLRTEPIVGKPVPALPNPDIVFTHVVIIDISIGREEISRLQFGLFGNECPESVSQIIDFLSDNGLTTYQGTSNFIGISTIPVSLTRGGIISNIEPTTYIELGVPIQSIAYARSRGISPTTTKNQNFRPQPKPSIDLMNDDSIVRSHDSPGLISIPYQGLGYGGTGYESDDETYESAFLITDNTIPIFDNQSNNKDKKPRRRVIGQIIDPQSMAFLERLTNLPTKRGIRGVIPGQTSGPPLIKTLVHDVKIAKVKL